MANKLRFRSSQDFYVRPNEGRNTNADEVNVRAIPVFRHSGRFDDRQVGGANPKGVLVLGDPERPSRAFIAKKPRAWLRECATEAILSTIARTLPIRVARFRLVRLLSTGPLPDVRFMSEVFLKPGEALVHGVEIAARFLESNPDDLREVFKLGPKNEQAEREFYTVEAIVPMLRAISRNDAEFRSLVRDFGKMVVFDAFVGVRDRHAENWGVVECTVHPERPLRFAPLYDTARGLFVSHGDYKLEQWDDPKQRAIEIERYAERSRPLFGCAGAARNLDHFKLVQHMLENMPSEFRRPARETVGSIRLPMIEKKLRIAFTRVVTRRRLECIIELLRYRYRRIRDIVFSEIS